MNHIVLTVDLLVDFEDAYQYLLLHWQNMTPFRPGKTHPTSDPVLQRKSLPIWV